MNLGRTVFAQLISFLPDREFRRCVSRYDGDASTRCGDDRQPEKHHDYIADLVKNPPPAQQLPREGTVVIRTGYARQFECHGAYRAPDHRGDEEHPEQPAQWAVLQEELDQLASRPIPPANDHRLKDETRKEVLLETWGLEHRRCFTLALEADASSSESYQPWIY